MTLTKEQILSIHDWQYQEVDVPEWGGTVRMRGLTSAERDQFELEVQRIMEKGGSLVLRARIVARCLVDDEGKRLFADAEIEKLAQKSGVVLDRLFWVAMRLSGIGQESMQEMQERLKKAPQGALPSD